MTSEHVSKKWLVVVVAYPAALANFRNTLARRCDAWCEVGTCWYNYDGDVSWQSQTTAQLDNVDSEKVSCRSEDKQDEHRTSWSQSSDLICQDSLSVCSTKTKSWHQL